MNEQKKPGGYGTIIFIWITTVIILGVFFTAINKTGQSKGNIAFVSVVFGTLLAFIIILIKASIQSAKIFAIQKRQREIDRQNGIERFTSIVHAGGLSSPINCNVTVTVSPTALTVNCAGNQYVLNIDKIRNVDLQSEVTQTECPSSTPIKGYVYPSFWGNGETFVIHPPKTKIKRNETGYAIISYENAHGIYKTLLLKDAVANTGICSKLVNTLRPKINQRINRVEL